MERQKFLLQLMLRQEELMLTELILYLTMTFHRMKSIMYTELEEQEELESQDLHFHLSQEERYTS